jgi:hypothetical protein
MQKDSKEIFNDDEVTIAPKRNKKPCLPSE